MAGPARAWLRGLDPPIYIVGVAPILVGAAATLHTPSPLGYGPWGLATAAFLLIHASVNVYNDAFDASSPADRFKAHSLARVARVPVLLALASGLLAVGCAVGIALWLRVGGLVVPLLSAAGIALVFLYHAPPFRLSHRGLGEVVAFLGFGPIPVWTTAALGNGSIPERAMVPGLLVGLAAALVLYYHNLAHRAADEAGHKRTMAVALGSRGAAWVGLTVSAVAVASTAVWTQDVRIGAPVGTLLLLLAFAAHRRVAQGLEARAWVFTLYGGMTFTLWVRLVA